MYTFKTKYMGIFDSKETLNKIKFLEKSYEKQNSLNNSLVDSLATIRKDLSEVEKRSPEYEKEAKQASKKTSEYRNKAQDTLSEINTLLSQAESSNLNVLAVKETVDKLSIDIHTLYNQINLVSKEVEAEKENVQERISSIEESIENFEEIFENHPDLDDEIADFESTISKIKDNESKSSQLVKTITSRKNELDRLYNEILGYTEVDEDTDTETFVKGLKAELEDSLEGLEDKLSTLQVSYNELEDKTRTDMYDFIKKQQERGNVLINEWEEKYKALNKQIEGLLPNALTAGLSHAFSGKKNEEVSAYEKHKKQFGSGILGMVTVSLIPFIISIWTLYNDHTLDTVINRIPKIVIAILPLYIPVLWLSISSSKKMNLSKRLIEEYSHKEVLSKTFEGLSKQIESLGEDTLSNTLKTDLLQNFLHMYSENPGKLISDYDKSDHPLMELLENSNKLENSIERLKKIPGMEKISDLIARKSAQKIEQATQSVEKGIDRVLALNEEKEDDEDTNIA